MDERDVQIWQAEMISKHVRPTLGYLYKLMTRMEKVGFLPNEPFFQEVQQAYNAMHRLSVRLHYLSCEKGVARPQRRKPQPRQRQWPPT